MYIIKYAIKWGFKRIRNIWDIQFSHKTMRTSLGVQVKDPLCNTEAPVQLLVWEDPTGHRATKPMHPNA